MMGSTGLPRFTTKCGPIASPLVALPFVLLSPLAATRGSAATPKDTLVIGLEVDPKSGDPRLIGGDANAQYLEELRFLPLISFDEQGNVKPVVAESFTADGQLAWKVKLRKGIKFANGRELVADDVVAMYERIMDAKAEPLSPRKGAFAMVTGVRSLGSHDVEFKLKEPDAAFLSNLSIGILPKEALTSPPEAINGKGFESGPYVVESATKTQWTLKANENFSHQAFAGAPGLTKPKLPKLTFKIIQDNGTRYAALVKGDLDLVQNSLDPDKVVQVQNNLKKDFAVVTRTALNTTFLAFNLKDKQFADVRVRKGIAHAINRDEILKFTMQGLGEKATGMFPPGLPYHEKSLATVAHDPAIAQKLFDEAGLKDPDGSGPQPRASFVIKVTTNKTRIAVAKAIAGQLKKVGIQADVQALEQATFTQHLLQGQVAAWIGPWTGYKDPDHLRFVFHSSQFPPNGGNRGFYANKKVDELLDKGKEELKLERRLPLYSEAQKLLAAELPYVYLWHSMNNAVISKKVEGFKIYADGRYASVVDVRKL